MEEHSSDDIPSTKQAFVPQETHNNPYDVSLVVEDGRREFKAHRRVLSDASPFFEKLFNSDMTETIQGVVRLEMLTELCLGKILEFIYTGNIQISTEDDAQEVIVAADYLVLPHLKILASRVLEQNLDPSNAVLTYQFAERFRCKELILNTTMFIYSNFTEIAKTEEFLNLSSEEVKTWISTDEINVSAEEDVFNIILTWIDRAKSERKKYFPELFRQVRLVYASRDFLRNEIVTNDLVNDNEGCMDLVKDAVKLTDSGILHFYSTKPRKSLETSVIVFYDFNQNNHNNQSLVYYFPQEGKWSRFTLPPGGPPGQLRRKKDMISCRDKLYFYTSTSLLVYDSFSNCWTACALPLIDREVFVKSEEEIYSFSSAFCNRCLFKGSVNLYLGDGTPSCGHRLMKKYKPDSNSWERVPLFDIGAVERELGPEGIDLSSDCWMTFSPVNIFQARQDIYALSSGFCNRCLTEQLRGFRNCGQRHISIIEKYKPEPNSWKHVAFFDMGPNIRKDICIVAKDSYIYFLGGRPQLEFPAELMTDSERYDLSTNTWDKIADLQKPRACAFGAAAYGKIFVFGGCAEGSSELQSCEVFDETTNEWHFIASLKQVVIFRSTVVCTDDKMFSVSVPYSQQHKPSIIEYYDPDKDEWETKTQIPLEWIPLFRRWYSTAAMRVFKGSKLFQSQFLQHEEDRPALPQSANRLKQSTSSDIPGQSTSSVKVCKCKCVIM